MKFGVRKPSIKRSVKARTTGRLKRTAKKAVNPLYGKKGMGLINNPKKAVYNKVYNKTTVDILKPLKAEFSKRPKQAKVTTTITKSSPTKRKVKKSNGGAKKTLYVVLIIFILILALSYYGNNDNEMTFVMLLTAGLIYYFGIKKKRKKSTTIDSQSIDDTMEVSTINNEDSEYGETTTMFANASIISNYSNEYLNLMGKRPRFAQYIGRPMDFPKYTDDYETNEKYSLRELLLLIWWGNTKHGRKTDTSIPKYFFRDYNLNAEKLTRRFYKEELLENVNGKVKLTDEGKRLYEKFKELWEIHSIKNYPSCLDIDFEHWDKNRFYQNYYAANRDFYKDSAQFEQLAIDIANKQSDKSLALHHAQWRDEYIIKANDFNEKYNLIITE